MKKRRNRQRKNRTRDKLIIILLLGIFVVFLSIICVLIYQKYSSIPNQEDFITESEEEESREPETESESEETLTEEEEDIAIDEMGFIFVGESHMVVADDEYARNGSDIDGIEYGKNLFFVQTGLNGWMGTAEWLTSTESQDGEDGALLQIDTILEANGLKKWYIFMQHGSSMSQYPDLWAVYEDVYKTYEERYPECEFYVISVPPVQEEKFLEQTGIKRSNQSIKEFNEYTKGLLKEGQYFDYYDQFRSNGFYQDYIHFEGKTYKSLFTSIMGNLLS